MCLHDKNSEIFALNTLIAWGHNYEGTRRHHIAAHGVMDAEQLYHVAKNCMESEIFCFPDAARPCLVMGVVCDVDTLTTTRIGKVTLIVFTR